MTTDTKLAFAHPEERAEASAGADPRDRISSARSCGRGRYRRLSEGTRAKSSGCASTSWSRCARRRRRLDDDVDRILSYDRITEAIADELAAERLNLLETLAERVAERILAEPQAMRAFIRIEKLDVGPYALGVEIVRSRAEVPLRVEGDAVHPLVVYLDNATLAAPDLSARLDALLAPGTACHLLRRPARFAAPGHRPQTDPAPGGPAGDRTERLGAWARAIRAAWWWPAAPRSTGRSNAADRSSGRRRNWCWMRSMGRKTQRSGGAGAVAGRRDGGRGADGSRRCCIAGGKPRSGDPRLILPPCQALRPSGIPEPHDLLATPGAIGRCPPGGGACRWRGGPLWFAQVERLQRGHTPAGGSGGRGRGGADGHCPPRAPISPG